MAYRRRHRSDSNQAEIVEMIRDIPGISIFITSSLGDGFPDIVVGYLGINYLVEIKSGSGDLTDDEREFFNDWRGQAAIARTADDLLKIIGIDP